MHPKNPYRLHPPSFKKLAEVWPALAPFVTENARGTPAVDFRDPEAARHVLYATLKRDFGLSVTLPEDRLCPGVPGRLDYVLWIKDILDSAPEPPEATPFGVDIGTGASAIYPLLATQRIMGCRMVGTEIDERSFQYASDNVSRNDLQSRIHLVPIPSSSSSIFPSSLSSLLTSDPPIDPARTFTLCNPPFYASEAEMDVLAAQKEHGPLSVSTGAKNEVVTEGGEVGFVGRMMEESVAWGKQIRWFTSMCGRLSSVAQLIEKYKVLGGCNYGVFEVPQTHTRRWFLAWSWQDVRLPDDVGRSVSPSSHIPLPPSTSSTLLCKPLLTLETAPAALQRALASLDLGHVQGEVPTRWKVTARENTWSRSARRRKKQGRPMDAVGSSESQSVLLGAVIDVSLASPSEDRSKSRIALPKSSPPGPQDSEPPSTSPRVQLAFRWTHGKDRVVFESFCMALTNQVAQEAEAVDGRDDAMQA